MKKRLICLCLVISVIAGLFALAPVSAVSDMKASDPCVNIIKGFEGFSGTPYLDSDGLYTIGYGTRCPTDMVEYYRENPMTTEEAEQELREVIVTYEKAVNAFIDRHGLTFTQQQFDAVVSLVYNVGPSWLTKGTTLIDALTGGATGNELIYAFTIYSMSGGNRSIGHVKRRLAEANIYLNGEYSRTLPDNFAYVIYDGQGGTVSSYNVQGYDTDLTAVPVVSASREGYEFKGWYTSATGGQLVTVLDATTKNMTLFAQWDSLSGETPGEQPGEGETDPVEELVVTVTGDDVNVRRGPGLSYGVVTTIDAGAELTITDVVENDGYTWGQFDGGWIALEYTDYQEETEQPCTHQYSVTAQDTPTCTAEGSVTYTCALCGDAYTEKEAATGHSYADATCTSAKKCETCGATSGSALGHSYADATCTSAKKCETCGATTGKALGHSYGNDGICTRCGGKDPSYKGPTVTVTGTNVNLRSGAGLSYSTVGKVTVGDKLVITQTKEKDGYLWGKCDKGWLALEYTNYDEVVPAPCEHDYDVTNRRSATCTAQGSVTYTCSNCDDSYTETTPAKGHDYGVIGLCSLCDGKDPDFKGLSVTVTANDVNLRSGAGLSYSKVGSVDSGTKLTITETKQNDGFLWGSSSEGWIALKYTNYDAVIAGACDHDYEAATCTKAKTCKLCGATSGSALGHSYSEATCTAARKCATCGTTSGSVLGHKYGSNGRCERCDAKDPDYQESEEIVTVVKLYATVINTDTLNVRQTPNGTILGSLRRGDKVEILEQKTVNGTLWGRYSKGWICLSTYGKLQTVTEKVSADTLSGLTGVTTASSLIVRAGAGTKYEIVHRLPKGTTIVILEKVPDTATTWARTNLGWVSMNYVRVEEQVIETGVTTASSLIVRAGAGSNYSIIDHLPKGTVIEILEKVPDVKTTWARTKYGWVSMNYVRVGEIGTVSASSLIVRAGAGSNYGIIDYLPKGTVVVILEKVPDVKTTWARTEYGWVSMNYIK